MASSDIQLLAGQVVQLAGRSVRVSVMADGQTVCRDYRKRIAVRNLVTNRLSYIPEWRLLKAHRQRTTTIADMAKKRGYSREFTPQTERRVRFEVDRIPPTLYDAVAAKAKREGVSLRALTLRLWKEWVER